MAERRESGSNLSPEQVRRAYEYELDRNIQALTQEIANDPDVAAGQPSIQARIARKALNGLLAERKRLRREGEYQTSAAGPVKNSKE